MDTPNSSLKSHAPKSSLSSSSDTPMLRQQGDSTLLICRNKHWKYISAYNGAWLSITTRQLDLLGSLNFNSPLPRHVEPALLFDVIKIRKLIDDATELAIKAASGFGPSPTASSTGFGEKLSKARILKMRQQATQKLSRAYKIDEIASSVSIMQSSSILEDVAKDVLKREPSDLDARYVHFFHEKIPSRNLVDSTTIESLTDIIAESPREPALLRTRAVVRAFKMDLSGAIQDITDALAMCRFQSSQHTGASKATDLPQNPKLFGDRPIREEEQPSSLEGQLYFHRASYNLNLACQNLVGSLPKHSDSNNNDIADHESRFEEPRKLVKTYAKRAIRDFLSLFSFLDYSPQWPPQYSSQMALRADAIINNTRYRGSEPATPPIPPTIYPVSKLFEAVAPGDLPPLDSNPLTEMLTFHPLLIESLHCFLIAHALAQTSAKEISRHALMVARLVRLDNGYPIFQSIKPAALGTWIEILNLTDNWIQLDQSWDALCMFSVGRDVSQHLHRNGRPITQELGGAVPEPPTSSAGRASGGVSTKLLRRWSGDERSNPSSGMDRAYWVSRWIREVPMVSGTAKRKKRAKKTSSDGREVDTSGKES
ncbi:hypothetical protein VHEMI06240 [[Torrubiella] hemipterigena]|uniref:Uncharacterized protein n=1 Tax=[Torrubiella] hemipterigena TaxID=1531966 RepID=A0A0A1TKL3_9HYPO|nr:hypothetical protein VHEMI06240 [[Torrubiella] hemipterigena]